MTVVAADMFAWLGVPVPADEAVVAIADRVVAASTRLVESRCIDVEEGDGHEESFDLAVVMHAGRLWKRRQTPEGFQLFEGGAIRVGRLDEDVAELLGEWLNWNMFG